MLVEFIDQLLHLLQYSVLDFSPCRIAVQLLPLLLLYVRFYFVKRLLLRRAATLVLMVLCKAYGVERIYDPRRRLVYLLATGGVVLEELAFRYGPVISAYALLYLDEEIAPYPVLAALTVGTAIWCFLHRYMRSLRVQVLLALQHVLGLLLLLHGLVILPLALHLIVNLSALFVVRQIVTKATRLRR